MSDDFFKKRMKRSFTVVSVDYNDILWLVQQVSKYDCGLADGVVTAETGRQFMRSIVKQFKKYL